MCRQCEVTSSLTARAGHCPANGCTPPCRSMPTSLRMITDFAAWLASSGETGNVERVFTGEASCDLTVDTKSPPSFRSRSNRDDLECEHGWHWVIVNPLPFPSFPRTLPCEASWHRQSKGGEDEVFVAICDVSGRAIARPFSLRNVSPATWPGNAPLFVANSVNVKS